jgi:phosphoribosyl-ATP pyrophosphohydrolase
MSLEVIKAMSDDELRESAEHCYMHLVQAAQLAPDTEHHRECFSAMYHLCVEMNARGMEPKAIGTLQ